MLTDGKIKTYIFSVGKSSDFVVFEGCVKLIQYQRPGDISTDVNSSRGHSQAQADKR